MSTYAKTDWKKDRKRKQESWKKNLGFFLVVEN
jgi:hypothetical protein